MPPFQNAASSSSERILNREPRITAAPAGLWDHGSPPGARIFVAPIDCRDPCRRTAAPWRRKSWDILSSGDSACRSAACWKSRHPKRQPPAGRVCGSGFHCQHRCCHCPRLPSLCWSTSRLNARLHGKVASGWCVSDVALPWFTAVALQTGVFHQRKVKESDRVSNFQVFERRRSAIERLVR
jgi:hypothetical protein